MTRKNEEAVDRFAKTVPMRYAVGLEQGVKLHDLLGIKALPYAIFVDNANTIVWRGQPEDIDGSLVESLLKKASG